MHQSSNRVYFVYSYVIYLIKSVSFLQEFLSWLINMCNSTDFLFLCISMRPFEGKQSISHCFIVFVWLMIRNAFLVFVTLVKSESIEVWKVSDRILYSYEDEQAPIKNHYWPLVNWKFRIPFRIATRHSFG
jgi:hypothetical protein